MIYIQHYTKDGNPKEEGFYDTDKGNVRFYKGNKLSEWAEPGIEVWYEPVTPGMTLQECKDKVVKDEGKDDFDSLMYSIGWYHAIAAVSELYLASNTESLRQEIEAYKESDEDKKRICRELDVVLFGADAAKQPSLCDILKSVQDLKQENQKLKVLMNILNQYAT